MIGDTELKVATAYDMLPEGAGTTSDSRAAAAKYPDARMTLRPCLRVVAQPA
jgi:hypothetical protein